MYVYGLIDMGKITQTQMRPIKICSFESVQHGNRNPSANASLGIFINLI